MRLSAWQPLLVALALFAALAPAHARDLLEVFKLALERDPTYAASCYVRQADQERIPQARAQLMPYISANAGADLDNSRRVRSLSDSRTSRSAAWTLSLVQPLLDLPAWNNLERADFQV